MPRVPTLDNRQGLPARGAGVLARDVGPPGVRLNPEQEALGQRAALGGVRAAQGLLGHKMAAFRQQQAAAELEVQNWDQMRAVGNQLTRFGVQLAEAEETMLVGTRSRQFEEGLAEKRLEFAKRTDWQNFNKEYRQYVREGFKRATAGMGTRAKDAFMQSARRAALSGYLEINKRSNALRVNELKAKLIEDLHGTMTLAKQSTSMADRQRHLASIENQLEAAARAGVISQAKKAQMMIGAGREISESMLTRAVMEAPRQVLDAFRRPSKHPGMAMLIKTLDPEHQRRVMHMAREEVTHLDATAKKAQAEQKKVANAAAAEASKMQRAELYRTLETGIISDKAREITRAKEVAGRLTPSKMVAARKYWESLMLAKKSNQVIQEANEAPHDQRLKILDKLKPKQDDEFYDIKRDFYRRALVVVTRRQKAEMADQGAASQAAAARRLQLMGNVIAPDPGAPANLALRREQERYWKEMRTPHSKRQFLSKQQRADWLAQFKSADARARVEMLVRLQEDEGDIAPQILTELGDKDHTLALGKGATFIASAALAAIRQGSIEGMHTAQLMASLLGTKESEFDVGDVQRKAISQEVRKQFRDWRMGAFLVGRAQLGGADSRFAKLAQGAQRALLLLTMRDVSYGAEAGDAAEKALATLERLFPAEQVVADDSLGYLVLGPGLHREMAREALAALRAKIPDDAFDQMNPEQVERLRRHGLWVNGDQAGTYVLVDPQTGKQVLGKAGEPYMVSDQNIEDYANSPAAKDLEERRKYITGF